MKTGIVNQMRTVLAFLFACSAFAAGTVQQTIAPLGATGNVALTFYWTGDSITGAVPVTPAQIGAASVQGYRLLSVEVSPGTPAPTAGYSLQILDSYGGDMMGGQITALSASTVQFFAANSATPPINGTFSLSITGQNVANAQGRVVVYFGPTQLINSNAGSPGPAGPAGAAGAAGPAGPAGSGTGAAASTYNFAPQTPGGTLTGGNPATVTMLPCPLGVNGTDTGHYLYISNGVGTAEAVLMTGGTCTSGTSSLTVTFTPANSHTGAWQISPASAGLQEAICGLSTAGGEVLIDTAITLLASVSSCSKTDVRVTKQAGKVISGSFTVLGQSLNLTTAGIVTIGNNPQTIENSFLGIGPAAANFPNYQFHVHGTGDPTYPPLDSLGMFGRLQNSSLATQGTAQQVLSIIHDFNGATGTPFPLFVQLHTTANTSSNGTPSIYAKRLKDAGATDIGIALHGECYQAGLGSCIGVNSEMHQTAAAAGTIYAVVGNLINDSVGFQHTAIAFHAMVNYPNGGTNLGGGMDILLNSGTHTYGLKVQDNGGQAVYPIVVQTQANQNPGTHLALVNAFAGTGQAEVRLGFYRGVIQNEISRITSNIVAAGNFGEGFLTFSTVTGAAITAAVKIDNSGILHMLRSSSMSFDVPTAFASLGTILTANGMWTYCNDCTIANPCAGGGTGAIAKRLNAVNVCN